MTDVAETDDVPCYINVEKVEVEACLDNAGYEGDRIERIIFSHVPVKSKVRSELNRR